VNFKRAKILCYEALSIFKSCVSLRDLRIGEAYHTLGHIYYLNKAYDIAKEYLIKSILIKEEMLELL